MPEQSRRPVGRPPLTPGQASRLIGVRVPADVYAAAEAAARAAGLSLPEWHRRVLTAATRRRKR